MLSGMQHPDEAKEAMKATGERRARENKSGPTKAWTKLCLLPTYDY